MQSELNKNIVNRLVSSFFIKSMEEKSKLQAKTEIKKKFKLKPLRLVPPAAPGGDESG